MTTNKPMPCARALHGFEGEATHELSFSAGVSIMLLRRIDENWLEGKLDGKVGIFPANYVKIQLGSPSVARESALAKSGKPCAIAIHSFRGGQPGDLPLIKGELIELTGTVGSDWLRGKVGDKAGIFPASFAQIIKPLHAETLSINGTVTMTTNGSCTSPEDDGERDGTLSSSSPPSNEGNGLDDDEVYELEFGKTTQLSDSRPKPVAKPRRRLDRSRHASAPGLEVVQNGVSQRTELVVPNETESHDQHPTPTRSAPAPPNATEAHSTSSDRQFMTLPKPKPRHKLSRHASESDQIRSLESELTIEDKMLESAQSLLLISKDEAKIAKLQEAVGVHQTNIDRIQQQLEEAKAKHDKLAQSSPAPPSPPSLPPRPAPPSLSKAQRRAKVIDELIVTERDFHHQMEICSSKILPALRDIPDINAEVLFGNIPDVTRLSCDFLTALEDSSRNEEAVGKVFMSYSSRLKEAYAVYCRNHDSAAAILEKYMDTPSTAERIRGVLDQLRGEIQAWDLQSLLIKPVQRVLKYPLLLDKLVETTSSKHDDRVPVMNARETMGQVAQDINEVKRRKDIVERYTTKDDKRGTMSMHSLQKKVRRMQQAFTQKTGLRTKTVDPKFDELEQKVLSIESLLRLLLRDIGNWQEELQHVVEGRETLSEGMDLYCSGVDSLTNFHHLLHSVQQAVKNNARFVKDHITTPLETLISLFQDPLHLIEKRKDKLLDYDHMQYVLDHTENEPEKFRQLQEDCTLARRNYEALNTQLLEELPNFIESTVKMLQHLLTTVVHAQYLFHSAVSKLYDPYCGDPLDDSTTIQAEHSAELAAIAKKLVQLSIVPTSLSINFIARSSAKKMSEGSLSPRTTHTLKSLVSPRRGGEMPQPHEEENEDEQEEIEELPEGTELEVLYDFEAQDKAELSVVLGQTVTLIRPHDRIGCKEWWLVRTDTAKGYVPAAYLAQYSAESS